MPPKASLVVTAIFVPDTVYQRKRVGADIQVAPTRSTRSSARTGRLLWHVRFQSWIKMQGAGTIPTTSLDSDRPSCVLFPA